MFNRVLKTAKFVIDVQQKFNGLKQIDSVRAEWLKQRIQEAGPTYIKVGQFIGSRRDVFNETIVEAMKGLQDNVDPAPELQMKEIIVDRLQPFINQISKIESRPVAAASIGQVHVVQLKNMKKAAIKVRRPNVREDIIMDISILMNILSVMDLLNTENIKETKELLDSFKEWLLDETDYTREFENWKLLKQSITSSDIIIPTLYSQLVCEDFLIMEYIPSEKMSVAKSRLSMDERRNIAEKLMDSFIGQLVVSGVVHGDPHPGNMGLTSDNKIVLYDMGNIIQIDETTRSKLKQLLFQIVSEEYEEAVKIMKKIDLFEVRDENKVVELLKKYADYLKTTDITVFFKNSSEELRGDLPVKFNSTVFRIVRVFGLLEGVCKELDPDFSYNKIFMKYMRVVGGDTDYVSFKMITDIRKFAKGVIKAIDDFDSKK